jgi:signal transduction histidine kinase
MVERVGANVPNADDVARGTLARAAWAGERSVSITRSVLIVLVLGRFFALGGGARAAAGQVDAIVEISVLALGLAASSALLWKLGPRSRPAPRGLLFASVTLDAVLCHLALLPNALWPQGPYEGILRIPDAAAILVVLAAAGVRLDLGVAALAALLHATSASILFAVDATGRAHITYGEKDVAIFFIYFVVAGLFAVASARGVRGLATESARAAMIAQRARLGLRDLLRDHHDVRSTLSSAMMRTEKLASSLTGDAGAAAAELREDLDEVARLIGTTKDRAYKELAELDLPQRVVVPPVVRSVVQVVTRRFPDVRFELTSGGGDALDALVVGGAQGLARVLLNVLVNAREGDGTRGATRVAVHVARGASAVVTIRVVDDGPGFPADVLAAAPGTFVSTKADGSGIGMFLVASVVEASGGLLERRNAARGGAEVVISLPPPA